MKKQGSLLTDEKTCHFINGRCLFLFADWQLAGPIFQECGTEIFKRTRSAARDVGNTNRGTKVHQCFIEVSRPVLRNDGLSDSSYDSFALKGKDIIRDPKKTGHYPQQVAIHGGDSVSKGHG